MRKMKSAPHAQLLYMYLIVGAFTGRMKHVSPTGTHAGHPNESSSPHHAKACKQNRISCSHRHIRRTENSHASVDKLPGIIFDWGMNAVFEMGGFFLSIWKSKKA